MNWELGHAVNRMNNPPQALNELRQALLYKWAEIPAKRLQGLVTSMPQRLAVIIHARDGSTQYSASTVVNLLPKKLE